VVEEDAITPYLFNVAREVEVKSFAFFSGDAEAINSITLDEKLVGAIIGVC